MSEGFLVGRDAANALGRFMEGGDAPLREQEAPQRLAGRFVPFEIVGDWEKRDGESVYSCLAVMIRFDGSEFVKDTDGFQFPLYSPLDLNDKPGYTVGTRCYAVGRGGRFEIVGGGSVGELEVLRLMTTLGAGEVGILENGKFVYCHPNAVEEGRFLEGGDYVMVGAYRGSGASAIYVRGNIYTTYIPLSRPVITGLLQDTNNVSVNFNNDISQTGITGPRIRITTSYELAKGSGWNWLAVLPVTAVNPVVTYTVPFPCYVYATSGTNTTGPRYAESVVEKKLVSGPGTSILSLDPAPGVYTKDQTIRVVLPQAIAGNSDYAVETYTSPVGWKMRPEKTLKITDITGSSEAGASGSLWLRLWFDGTMFDAINKGEYTIKE
jgi:hypothetical protein